MALNELIPIDGDGVSTGTLVSQICAAIRTLRASLNAGELDRLGFLGNVGIDEASPSLPLDVKAKSGMSAIGGFCVKLTNETGNVSVAGDVVIASTATVDAVEWAGGNEFQPIGVFLESGVADGSEAWIVVAGIADVHMDAAGCALGDRILCSGTARRGEADNGPSAADHYKEIGHAIEIAAANANARCVIHFL